VYTPRAAGSGGRFCGFLRTLRCVQTVSRTVRPDRSHSACRRSLRWHWFEERPSRVSPWTCSKEDRADSVQAGSEPSAVPSQPSSHETYDRRRSAQGIQPPGFPVLGVSPHQDRPVWFRKHLLRTDDPIVVVDSQKHQWVLRPKRSHDRAHPALGPHTHPGMVSVVICRNGSDSGQYCAWAIRAWTLLTSCAGRNGFII
jgi:hypothetical protein